jgi:hypothetical protein
MKKCRSFALRHFPKSQLALSGGIRHGEKPEPRGLRTRGPEPYTHNRGGFRNLDDIPNLVYTNNQAAHRIRGRTSRGTKGLPQ